MNSTFFWNWDVFDKLIKQLSAEYSLICINLYFWMFKKKAKEWWKCDLKVNSLQNGFSCQRQGCQQGLHDVENIIKNLKGEPQIVQLSYLKLALPKLASKKTLEAQREINS